MQRYSALGFGKPEEGHLKSKRMHAGCCAIITTPMEAGWSCNAEEQEEIRHAYFPWLTSASAGFNTTRPYHMHIPLLHGLCRVHVRVRPRA